MYTCMYVHISHATFLHFPVTLAREQLAMDVKAKLRLALGSIKDQAAIGKAVISGQNISSDIEVALVRCTDRSDVPVDEKYVHEILFLVSNAPGSVAFLARKISKRLETTRDQVVALKTLVLLHRLLRGGDRNFEQDIRNSCLSGDLQLNLRWFARDSHNFPSSFLRGYAVFLEERMGWVINQAGKLEPVNPSTSFKSSDEKSTTELTLHRLSKCQTFLDRVMNCLPGNISRPNRVTQSALNIVLRESFRVYASFNEGIEAMVVDSFVDFNNPKRVSARNILRRAVYQSQKLHGFYEDCKRTVVGRNMEYPLVRVITAADVSTVDDRSFLSYSSRAIGNCSSHTKSTEVRTAEEEEDEGREADEGTYGGASATLFSCKLETKISTEWVAFDDDEEDSQNSIISANAIEDYPAGSANDLLLEWESF